MGPSGAFVSNLISVSSAPIAKLGNKKYYDLPGTLEVMKRVYPESVVDGFELQLEPEWDSENPPLTDAHFADWGKTPKYTNKDILALVKRERLPILSVHASRDVGNYLCSNREQDLEKGERLIRDSLSLADKLEANVCAFHLWDTWNTEFDVNHLERVFSDIADRFPKVKASVENIPTSLGGHTPYSLAKSFEYVTLDLKWACMYKELDAFEQIIDKVANIHLHARLQKDKWTLDHSTISFYQAQETIKNKWKYPGLLTVEPEGLKDSSSLESFLKAMRSLRT